jgi:hypothetical protein
VATLRIAALIVAALAFAAPAHAQTVYRSDVPAGDAAPTGGSFSIRFPIPFTDVELRADDPDAPTAIVRTLTGADSEGIRFTAVEMPYMGQHPKPMESFMNSVKKRPGAEVSDVRREQNGDMEILSFLLTAPEGGYYFRLVRTNEAQFMQVVQFPEVQRGKATEMKDDFFSSFRITRP